MADRKVLVVCDTREYRSEQTDGKVEGEEWNTTRITERRYERMKSRAYMWSVMLDCQGSAVLCDLKEGNIVKTPMPYVTLRIVEARGSSKSSVLGYEDQASTISVFRLTAPMQKK